MRLCKPLYYRGTSADFTQIVLLLSVGLQLAILVLWIVSSGQRNKTSIASSSLTFGSSLLLCVLSHFEHTRTVRPSTIIETYLFFSIGFDAVQLRTLWNQSVTTIAAILSANLVVKIAVLFLEAKSKKGILTKSYSNLSPETTSGIFGRSTFYWIKPLLMTGFTSTISIDESPPLDKELSSESLHNRLQRTWDRCKLTIFLSRTLLDKLMMLWFSKPLQISCSGNCYVQVFPDVIANCRCAQTLPNRIQLLPTISYKSGHWICRRNREHIVS